MSTTPPDPTGYPFPRPPAPQPAAATDPAFPIDLPHPDDLVSDESEKE